MTAQPIEHPAVGRQRLRSKIEGVINRLIDTLDRLDGDPDFEEGGDDEDSLGTVESGIWIGKTYYPLCQDRLARWTPLCANDREEEDEHDEASLCGVTFGAGGPDELEEACEDEGAQCEDEGAVTGDDEPEMGE
ncbi:MAG: hypothetical protein ACRED4_02775 [Brevundimonas sp.]